ncbi:MAG: hypothetical protein HF967_02525 [Methanosarcinales archaeon]|nr:hypothetical protein [Methanosarcinales archaeon]
MHKKGWSNRRISCLMSSSTKSISKWLKIDEDEIEVEQRGWKKGIQRSFVQS